MPATDGAFEQHGDGELVGVKVPVELAARLEHIDDHVRYRIVIDIQLVLAEAVLNKVHQRGPMVERAAGCRFVVAVTRDEAVGPFEKDASGVVFGEQRIVQREIHVSFLVGRKVG